MNRRDALVILKELYVTSCTHTKLRNIAIILALYLHILQPLESAT